MPGEGRRVRQRDQAFSLQTAPPRAEAITIDERGNRSVLVTGGNLGSPLLGTQVTVSEGHQWPPRKGSPADIGGDFDTSRSYVVGSNKSRDFRVGPNLTVVQVSNFPPFQPLRWFTREVINSTPVYPLQPSATTTPFPPSIASSDSQLMQKGATAMSKCKPTNSVADLATFLGEFYKDGIPKLVGAQSWNSRSKAFKDQAKTGSDEFLNVAFGWTPFVSDIRNFATAIRKAERILSQFERDSGRVVRRQFRFPSQKVTNTTTVRTHVKPFGVFHSDVAASLPYGNVIRTSETVRNVWFSGAFTYHLPSGYDSRNRMIRAASQADRLFGINLTPELVWNLAPWSWAVDWFTNLGDVVSNVSDMVTDGLVMRYGYIMEHCVSTDTYTFQPEGGVDNPSFVGVPPLILVTETKKRRQANPFGFGLLWSALSARQLAIAAALGISRSK